MLHVVHIERQSKPSSFVSLSIIMLFVALSPGFPGASQSTQGLPRHQERHESPVGPRVFPSLLRPSRWGQRPGNLCVPHLRETWVHI